MHLTSIINHLFQEPNQQFLLNDKKNKVHKIIIVFTSQLASGKKLVMFMINIIMQVKLVKDTLTTVVLKRYVLYEHNIQRSNISLEIFYYKIVTVTIVLITILRNDMGKRIDQTRPGKNLNFYFKCPFCPQFIQTFNPFPLSLSSNYAIIKL